MADIQGTFEDRFEGVAQALSQNIDQGLDVGASVAVALNGELVVDIWGGHADSGKTATWEQDTLVNAFSTTKTMVALCALILADRGELDFDAPVARYWPEFSQAGKEDVLVRYLLGHTSGLSGWEQPLELEELGDWERCTSLLAAPGARGGAGGPSGSH